MAKSTLEQHNLYMHTNSLCIPASYEHVLITAINLSQYSKQKLDFSPQLL